jgi:hypothetical protein
VATPDFVCCSVDSVRAPVLVAMLCARKRPHLQEIENPWLLLKLSIAFCSVGLLMLWPMVMGFPVHQGAELLFIY